MIANSISILSFGASASAADNTLAIQKTIDAAKAQGKMVYVPPGSFKHAGALKLDGVKIAGDGDSSALIGTVREKMALQLTGDGAGVMNLRLEGTDGARLSAYEACGISVIGAKNFVVKGVTIKESSAAGIHITGSTNGLVENNTLKYTGADSIHMSNNRGANSNITVRNNNIDHPHDDGVAIVSYGGSRSTHPASHHILVENNTVTNQEWGRGYTVVGGTDVTIRGNYYDNNMSGGAGIYIAAEGSYETRAVNNVWVENNLIKNAGGTKHASIQVYAGNNPVTNVHIDNNVIYASKAASIVTNGSGGGKNIYISDNVSFGPAKAVTDFVTQLNGTLTIESNNKILAKTAYPGDAAYDVGYNTVPVPVVVSPPPVVVSPVPDISAPAYVAGTWNKVADTTKIVAGTASSQTLTGSDYSEKIDGKGGEDVMVGLKGHDTYYVNSAGDRVVEQSGHGVDQIILSFSSFTMSQFTENVTVTNSSGAKVVGNSAENWIIGGAGIDTLDGGAGRDKLTGGAGNDVFVFKKGQLNGDQVTDFMGNGTAAGDVLKFEGFVNAKLTHVGDVWTVTHSTGAETFKIVGVTANLSSGDALFV